VLGVSASGTEPAAPPAVAAVRATRGGDNSGLPFTGLTVGFLAAGGLGLVLAGTALRRAGTLRHR
jgi:hypothetical protein